MRCAKEAGGYKKKIEFVSNSERFILRNLFLIALIYIIFSFQHPSICLVRVSLY